MLTRAQNVTEQKRRAGFHVEKKLQRLELGHSVTRIVFKYRLIYVDLSFAVHPPPCR